MAQQTKYDPHTLAESLHNADNIASLEELDSNTYLMNFVNGGLHANKATFVKTNSGDEFIMLPKEAINHILSILQNSHEESIKVMLRYAIKDLMPFDLEDAMAVALHELELQRQKDGNLPKIDVKNLAKKVRIEYPNLFIHF